MLDSRSESYWETEAVQSDIDEPIRLMFDLDQSEACDRFFLFTGSDDSARTEDAAVYAFNGDQRTRVDDNRLRWLSGLLVVDLAAAVPERLMIKATPADKASPFTVYEAWCEAAPSD